MRKVEGVSPEISLRRIAKKIVPGEMIVSVVAESPFSIIRMIDRVSACLPSVQRNLCEAFSSEAPVSCGSFLVKIVTFTVVNSFLWLYAHDVSKFPIFLLYPGSDMRSRICSMPQGKAALVSRTPQCEDTAFFFFFSLAVPHRRGYATL